MNVQVGDIVKEGDVLCTLDSTSIEEKIADLEKSVSNANAVSSINTQQAADALQQAKDDQTTTLAAAQKTLDRAKGQLQRRTDALRSGTGGFRWHCSLPSRRWRMRRLLMIRQ